MERKCPWHYLFWLGLTDVLLVWPMRGCYWLTDRFRDAHDWAWMTFYWPHFGKWNDDNSESHP